MGPSRGNCAGSRRHEDADEREQTQVGSPLLCFMLVRPDRRAVAAYPAHQLPRWVAPFLRNMGSAYSSVMGVTLPGKVASWAWRSAFSSTCPATGSFFFSGHGAWVPAVWGLGARCLGPGCPLSGGRVSSVWGQGVRCLGPGCPLSGVRVSSVWGLGAHCLGPGYPLSGGRVSRVWGLGAHCPGAGCLLSGAWVPTVWGQGVQHVGSGCTLSGAWVPAVWGLGVQCVESVLPLSVARAFSAWGQGACCMAGWECWS